MGIILNNKNWLDIATAIYRYQNFKTSVAIKHIRGNLAKSTKASYFQQGCYYFVSGKVYNNHCPAGLVKALDTVKNMGFEILIPNKKNKKKDYKAYNIPVRENISIEKPIEVKEPVVVKTENIVNESSMFGVKCGETIYLMKNQDDAELFMKGVKALKDVAGIIDDYAKIVKVSIKEV